MANRLSAAIDVTVNRTRREETFAYLLEQGPEVRHFDLVEFVPHAMFRRLGQRVLTLESDPDRAPAMFRRLNAIIAERKAKKALAESSVRQDESHTCAPAVEKPTSLIKAAPLTVPPSARAEPDHRVAPISHSRSPADHSNEPPSVQPFESPRESVMTNGKKSVEELSEREREELEAWERLLNNPALSRGLAFRAIRDGRLYRASHRTFEQYCEERWGQSKTEVNRQIQHAAVLKNLTQIGVTRVPESHARQLAALPPDEQRAVYKFLQGTAADGRVTEPHIKSVVTVVKDLMVTDAMDDGTGAMVSWADLPPERKAALLQAAVTEETYERQQRQSAHVRDSLEAQQLRRLPPPALLNTAFEFLGENIEMRSSAPGDRPYVRSPKISTLAGDRRVFLHADRHGAEPAFRRLLSEYTAGVIVEAVSLVPTWSLGTSWFQELFEYPVCIVSRASGVESYALVYLGRDDVRFARQFENFGVIVRRVYSSHVSPRFQNQTGAA